VSSTTDGLVGGAPLSVLTAESLPHGINPHMRDRRAALGEDRRARGALLQLRDGVQRRERRMSAEEVGDVAHAGDPPRCHLPVVSRSLAFSPIM
jgi:hypothetical protein